MSTIALTALLYSIPFHSTLFNIPLCLEKLNAILTVFTALRSDSLKGPAMAAHKIISSLLNTLVINYKLLITLVVLYVLDSLKINGL